MPRSHATVPLALALLSGCGNTGASRVEIAAHYVPACAPAPQAAPSRLELSALGDFEPSNASIAILRSDADDQALELPAGTQAAELRSLDGDDYWGAGTVDAHKRLSILLWPEHGACELARIETDAVDVEGWVLGGSARLGTLLALIASAQGTPNGDDNEGGSGVDAAYRVDASSGLVERLPPDRAPRSARRAASLSELGEQLLLAGGLDANGRALDSAELFDPALGRFTDATMNLARARARHAAVPLPGGASLLIGGVSETGAALRSVEVVTPGPQRTARAYDLLAAARIAPRAVLLGGDRVLVGGGYQPGPDGTRTPVPSAELLHTDLSLATEPPLMLTPAALDRAFAALGPGSALAVGGCEPSATPAADCVPCAEGCVSTAVFWIDSRGQAHALEPLPASLAAPAPELVAGADGSPWLIAGNRLGRFDPWRARFAPVEMVLPTVADSRGVAFAMLPGLFMWLGQAEGGAALSGLQHSQRGPWTQDVAPLLLGSASGLVPDRPPLTSDMDVTLEYSPASGLALAGPEAMVSVADTEYAAFGLELALAEGPPPSLRLLGAGSDVAAAFGGLDCPWPTDPSDARPARLRVQRSLDSVQLERLDGSGASIASVTCVRPLPPRVSLQLIGTRDGISRVTRLEIARASD